MHRDTPKMTTGRRSAADVSKVEVEGANPALIKAHGNFTTSVVAGIKQYLFNISCKLLIIQGYI